MSGAVYLDLDGTLLDADRRVGPAGRAAVEVVRDAGLVPVVLTGRSAASARAIAAQLGITDVVCELGAVILRDGASIAVPRPADDAAPGPATVAPGRAGSSAADPARALTVVVGPGVEHHEPGVERRAGAVLRSARPAVALTAALREAGVPEWWAVDNGPSHHPLADGRPARVVHLRPRGIDKVAGVRGHIELAGLMAGSCAVVGDSPADLACRSAVGDARCVRSDDPAALEEAHRLGVAVTRSRNAEGALEAVRSLVGARRRTGAAR